MARSALLNVMVQAAMKAGRSLSRDFGEFIKCEPDDAKAGPALSGSVENRCFGCLFFTDGAEGICNACRAAEGAIGLPAQL